MKALFIAPVPPPMSGNALPVKVLYENLKKDHDIELVNLSKKNHKAGIDSLSRIFKILSVLIQVGLKCKRRDLVYLAIAESFAGNIRDIIIYLLCILRLKSVVIHMLGGAGLNNMITKKKSPRFFVNRFFLKRIGGIIVEGKTQHDMFSIVTDVRKIHIIPNFAESFLFENEKSIISNFQKVDPLRIIFISNMLYGKGHFELIEAYKRLDKKLKKNIQIDFAGKIVTDYEKGRFENKIKGEKNIKYHGSVYGFEKKKLFANAHVFCLPTYYPYEGQPFCIIEAYATGCVVITTYHSGISDIFTDELNGYKVEKKSVDSLVFVLERVYREKEQLCAIALSNQRIARKKHSQIKYIELVKKAFMSVFEAKDIDNEK